MTGVRGILLLCYCHLTKLLNLSALCSEISYAPFAVLGCHAIARNDNTTTKSPNNPIADLQSVPATMSKKASYGDASFVSMTSLWVVTFVN